MDIFMNPQQVRNGAEEILGEKKELLSILASLDDIVSALPGVWQDPAQVKFTGEYNSMKPEFQKFCESLQFFADHATEHAKRVEDASVIL